MHDPLIFIVDDDPLFLKLVTFSLNKEFPNIKTFTSGESIISHIKNVEHPDIIITDYYMEGISGFEVLKEVKKLNNNIKVIFYTGQGGVKNAIRAINMGAHDYIIKSPGSYKYLIKSIKDLYRTEDKLDYFSVN
jgi:DNA-binding NtrC family response regulator